MKVKKYFICLIIGLFGATCDISELATIPEYPVKVESLSLSDLEKLNAKYHAENNGKLCSTLNEYGYTGFSRVLFPGNKNPCLNRTPVKVELTETDSLVALAKKTLLKNQEYTAVTDTSLLELETLEPLNGCTICEGPNTNSVPIEWKVNFKPQKKDGTEIHNTSISVFIDAKGVNRIWGNWYPDFYVPGLINFGYVQAKLSLVGTEIEINRLFEKDRTFVVSEEYMQKRPVYEYLPLDREGFLEFRKTWKVQIDYPGYEVEGWNAYVDVFDGTLLQLEALEEPVLEQKPDMSESVKSTVLGK